MSGPFVPGGPTSQPPITSPDASTRRALFQNRGQEALGSTLSLGNESVLNQPTPQQIPEQDGVGDGNQNSGNAFQSPATPSYELGKTGVVPSDLSAANKVEPQIPTPAPTTRRPAPTPPQPNGATTSPEDVPDAKDPLYSGGAYWKFLGPLYFICYK